MTPDAWLRNSRTVYAVAAGLLALAGIGWWLASFNAQILAMVGLQILLLAVALRILRKVSEKGPETVNLGESLETLLTLSADPQIAEVHTSMAESLQRIATKADPIYRKLALRQLSSLTEQCRRLADDSVEFPSTESWRVVYEELLRSPGLHHYRSVAHIESAHYWQEGPGQQSTLLNLELHDAGVINIERIAIIADHLWRDGETFPVEPVHAWLDQQYRHGIWLRLVRESQLAGETDLVFDFGIYGTRAVGTQLADMTGRTIRFDLSFDFEKVKRAEEVWKRLQVFSTSYSDLLDRIA
jgi:hypothetical protein